jgi:glycosyltransferase involved in cell wall biosynthesis
MRIVIDMQGAQTESRFRGIGRYTIALAQAIVRNRGQNEVILVLSGLFPSTIEPIRAAFDDLLSQENIRVWYAPGPVFERAPQNARRRELAELIREAFISALKPDMVHICSLFEGYIDDAVTSIGRFDHSTPVSVSLYDLIPLLNPAYHAKPRSTNHQYYQRKLDHLRKASVVLAISESSRREGMRYLEAHEDDLVNISTAVDACFRRTFISASQAQRLLEKFGILRPFVLYTGGGDPRKNLLRLVQAYALLPAGLRASHQLVLSGRILAVEVGLLRAEAESAGMRADELIFTSHIPDVELVSLYNLCKLFVFPSWHEGFGLPALEAMACGSAAIGANTSSVPEVIGRADALFDPYDVSSICSKIAEVLEDDVLRADLVAHGLRQAKRFSWDDSARRAIAAFEQHQGSKAQKLVEKATADPLTRLIQSIAAAAPRHLAESEIIGTAYALSRIQTADSRRQLFIDISELVKRDARTGVQRVTRNILKELLDRPPSGYLVKPVFATNDSHGYAYAHEFTAQFLGAPKNKLDALVEYRPGDVFLGLDLQHHTTRVQANYLKQMRDDGVNIHFVIYDLLPVLLPHCWPPEHSVDKVHHEWLSLISQFDGAACISRSVADELAQWQQTFGPKRFRPFRIGWFHLGADLVNAISTLGLPDDADYVLAVLAKRPTFLSVGTVEPRKCHGQTLDAFELLWNQQTDANLVIVGKQGWMVDILAERLRVHPELNKRLFWMEGVSDEYLEKVYLSSTCLIAASEGEGFGLPLIEAAQHDLPIIARDIPVFREVAGEHAYYFTGKQAGDLATCIEGWMDLHASGQAPRVQGISWLTWKASAEQLKRIVLTTEPSRRRTEHSSLNRIYVDITDLARNDRRTGIQRVTRSILAALVKNPPVGYQIQPVYATHTSNGYLNENSYAEQLTAKGHETKIDNPIIPTSGDVFLGLDFAAGMVVAQQEYLDWLQGQGVCIYFVVYDLLPINLPQWFPDSVEVGHRQWLQTIAKFDGAICISRAVKSDLDVWLSANGPERSRPFDTSWFHLGGDVENSAPTQGIPENADQVLAKLSAAPSFLMVGTVEPRKGHKQAIEAFEILWSQGIQVNLIIVGGKGWMVDALSERLKQHTELNKRLFWMEHISDQYMEMCYEASTSLIAASYAEGFGLPLIEAAKYKLPIIARDIPVFREVAGAYAFYFDGLASKDLAEAIRKWILLYQKKQHPKSAGLPWLSWRESTEQLKTKIVGRSRGFEC